MFANHSFLLYLLFLFILLFVIRYLLFVAASACIHVPNTWDLDLSHMKRTLDTWWWLWLAVLLYSRQGRCDERCWWIYLQEIHEGHKLWDGVTYGIKEKARPPPKRDIAEGVGIEENRVRWGDRCDEEEWKVSAGPGNAPFPTVQEESS